MIDAIQFPVCIRAQLDLQLGGQLRMVGCGVYAVRYAAGAAAGHQSRRAACAPRCGSAQAAGASEEYVATRKAQQKTLELYLPEHVSMTGCLPCCCNGDLIFMFTAILRRREQHTIQMILDLQNGIEPVFRNWLWIRGVLPFRIRSVLHLPAAGGAASRSDL